MDYPVSSADTVASTFHLSSEADFELDDLYRETDLHVVGNDRHSDIDEPVSPANAAAFDAAGAPTSSAGFLSATDDTWSFPTLSTPPGPVRSPSPSSVRAASSDVYTTHPYRVSTPPQPVQPPSSSPYRAPTPPASSSRRVPASSSPVVISDDEVEELDAESGTSSLDPRPRLHLSDVVAAARSTAVSDLPAVAARLTTSFRVETDATAVPPVLLACHAGRADLARHLRDEFVRHRMANWPAEAMVLAAMTFLDSVVESSGLSGL